MKNYVSRENGDSRAWWILTQEPGGALNLTQKIVLIKKKNWLQTVFLEEDWGKRETKNLDSGIPVNSLQVEI